MENRTVYLLLGFTYPILLFLVFYIPYLSGSPVPFSLEAFISPYSGEFGLMAILLVFVSIMDLVWYHTTLLPQVLKSPGSHLLAVSFPSAVAAFGFLIGILDMNPWASLPFILVAFLHYVYAYSRVNEGLF